MLSVTDSCSDSWSEILEGDWSEIPPADPGRVVTRGSHEFTWRGIGSCKAGENSDEGDFRQCHPSIILKHTSALWLLISFVI